MKNLTLFLTLNLLIASCASFNSATRSLASESSKKKAKGKLEKAKDFMKSLKPKVDTKKLKEDFVDMGSVVKEGAAKAYNKASDAIKNNKELMEDLEDAKELAKDAAGQGYDSLLANGKIERYKLCTKEHIIEIEETKKIVRDGMSKIVGMQSEIYQAFINKEKLSASHSSEGEENFYEKLSCINERIKKDRLIYQCQSDYCVTSEKDIAGYVSGNPHRRRVSSFLDSGKVYLCIDESKKRTKEAIDNLIRENPEMIISTHGDSYRTQVLIHEIAHLCGAEDLGYFTGLTAEEVDFPQWHNNADTYGNILNDLEYLLNDKVKEIKDFSNLSYTKMRNLLEEQFRNISEVKVKNISDIAEDGNLLISATLVSGDKLAEFLEKGFPAKERENENMENLILSFQGNINSSEEEISCKMRLLKDEEILILRDCDNDKLGLSGKKLEIPFSWLGLKKK